MILARPSAIRITIVIHGQQRIWRVETMDEKMPLALASSKAKGMVFQNVVSDTNSTTASITDSKQFWYGLGIAIPISCAVLAIILLCCCGCLRKLCMRICKLKTSSEGSDTNTETVDIDVADEPDENLNTSPPAPGGAIVNPVFQSDCDTLMEGATGATAI
ncbi:unnamed protein product [Owenia fusiformis]|uniref:Uncharacterized protein n=1 Tax=Owenia fusiformis TaxID=6347 RepID=A0A8S4NN97_OWEFU|nr:unnamed protein product [Owenia fusiformis]